MVFVIVPLLLLILYRRICQYWLLRILCFSLGLSFLGLCASWTWLTIFFPMLGKFSAIISSNTFSGPFSCSSPSGTPIMWVLVHLMLSQRLREGYLLLFPLSFFFLYSVVWQWFPSFCPSCHLSIFLSQLFCYWFLLVYYSFLFFSSFRSLVNISYIFSIVFLRLWIIFTMIILNSFYGRSPISTSLSCFSGVLYFPFIWNITFCFFILINFPYNVLLF